MKHEFTDWTDAELASARPTNLHPADAKLLLDEIAHRTATPDLTYVLDLPNQRAHFTGHSPAGLDFLADHLPSGRCWSPRLRTDAGTGYVQIAVGRGLTVRGT